MKKLLYDIRVWFIWKYAWLKVNNPWHNAYLRAKMAMYRDSDWWRIRATEMSPEFADQHFIDNGEHKCFDSKVREDKMLMLRIILLPFSIQE